MFSVRSDSFQHKKKNQTVDYHAVDEKSVVIKKCTFVKITMVQLRLSVVAADVILRLETSCLHLRYHGFVPVSLSSQVVLRAVQQGINDHSSMSSSLCLSVQQCGLKRVILSQFHDLPLPHTLDL